MLILAVDTAGPMCAACIYDTANETFLSSISEEIGRGHAEVLPSIVERALNHANLDFSDLSLLAVSEGPGSFAGIRVGISFIRALALALNIPSIGISSLIAMAHATCETASQNALAAIDARRGEIYLAVVDSNGSVVIEPAKYSVEDANMLVSNCKYVLCGNGVGVLETDNCQIAHQNASAPIEMIAKLAVQKLEASGNQIKPPKAQYLRAADAKKQAGFVLDRL
ncbi:tRNA (adenosine(37)-N6)-threonylcarbamoyltransferase complex dimerization subunit type 1 TsaB [Lentilitoribacter sp. EG35]|uniref:tRNA (adenosine(37)-N6)-threonylcarbamoyltransferase complex dimerization subunit type 1 TsaB n=1 Tax=Lentilitoribacter sp. EG35 TaxID=3234192 RepID=UPI00346040D8